MDPGVFFKSDFVDGTTLALVLRETGGAPAAWEPALRPRLAVGEMDCGDCGEELFTLEGTTLSRMDLMSAGIGMWCTMLTAGQSAG